MTREDELRQIAKAAAEETVRQFFEKIGVDASEPFEMQRDFQHLRDWRKTVEAAKAKGFLTIIGTLTLGGIAALWASIGGKAIGH
jgi:hypothetical protein